MSLLSLAVLALKENGGEDDKNEINVIYRPKYSKALVVNLETKKNHLHQRRLLFSSSLFAQIENRKQCY